MGKLNREFYNRDAIIVAKELLGKLLVRQVDGHRMSARIVETEAYMGVTDKAAHSYGGRRTQRVEVMYGDPGYAYVFLIYGMHSCFNIVTQEEGIPQAVLIRALEPVEDVEHMAQNRYGKSLAELGKTQMRGLTNGPGKLCAALSIDRSLNGADLCGGEIYLEFGEPLDERKSGCMKTSENSFTDKPSMVTTTRVGIDYAQEAKEYPWRFYMKGNEFVSVK